MDSTQMETRVTNFISRKHAMLRDYSLKFNKLATKKSARPGEGKGNIVSLKGEFVEGAVYEIDSSGRDELDKFEGYPDNYDRITVKVLLDDGVEVEAFTYVAQPSKIKEGLKPTKEYLNHYLAGKDVLSKEYYHKLKSWPTVD